MDQGVRTGIFFGATSGVITTIGLMVGLSAGTHSVTVVVGGVIVIAIADAMSDALGIHLSQEANPATSAREVWQATVSTFATKLTTTLTFIIPLLLLPLGQAIVASVLWSYLIISVLSVLLARDQQTRVAPVLAEHLTIATIVVAASHFVGVWIRTHFV